MAKRERSTSTRKPRSDRRPRRATPSTPDVLELALASFAHEVRTPLNGILALAELLSASDLPAREREWATALKSAAEHLANLTTVIVDGARATTRDLVLKHDMFDLAALAGALAQSLGARAGVRGLTARHTIPDGLPRRVMGDEVRLRAALENLIDNAVKFTKAGEVGFAVAAEPAADGRLRVTFAISDDGAGLAPAELRRLFRPFSQAKLGRRLGGGGLGLVFARSVARAMGGDVTVESTPGKGSIFRLSAELEEARDDAAAQLAGGAITPTRPLRLLCAEDNPFGRVVLNTIATALGHRIDFVYAGDAVVDAVRNGGYDAVLMDVMLPGTDGLGATRRIRALGGTAGAVPIIGISGGGPAGEAAARRAGMNAYLAKPVGPAALSAALAAVTAEAEPR